MKVLVIGEYCTDIFVYGESKRLSPEAPVPVFIPKEEICNPGMAGNVVKNIEKIYPKSEVIGLHQKNEIRKTRFVDQKSNHMFIRIDTGEKNTETFNLNKFDTEMISNSDIVIVSDYDKGFLTNENLVQIGKLAKMSILDSKKKLSSEVINSFDFVKLNEVEYENNMENINVDNVIITLGSKGAKYKGKIYESPCPKETIDVSGAGDTFTSAFILKFYETRNISESIIYANELASIVVSKRGVATP